MASSISSTERPPQPPDYRGVQGVPAEFYEADLALLDRYQGFSAEIVRIALLGIAVLGFFLEKLVSKAPPMSEPEGALIRYCLAASVALFAAATCAGLLHRYYSADGIYYHIRAVRDFLLAGRNQTEAVRSSGVTVGTQFNRSGRFLIAAELLLAAGGIAVGVAVGALAVTIRS